MVLLLLPAVIGAQDAIPVDKQANLLLKALAYDRGLKKRAPEGIRILVVHQGAAEAAGKATAAFTTAGKSKVKGLAVRAFAAESKTSKTCCKRPTPANSTYSSSTRLRRAHYPRYNR